MGLARALDRPQEHRIERIEQERAETQADREDQRRRQGEARGLPDRPHREADILDQSFGRCPAPGFSRLFLDADDAAEVPSRRRSAPSLVAPHLRSAAVFPPTDRSGSHLPDPVPVDGSSCQPATGRSGQARDARDAARLSSSLGTDAQVRKSAVTGGCLSRPHHAGDGPNETVPAGFFGRQLLSAGRGQLIVLGALIVFRDLPFGGDPPLSLEAVQRRIERSPLDSQLVVRAGANGQTDAVAMLGTQSAERGGSSCRACPAAARRIRDEDDRPACSRQSSTSTRLSTTSTRTRQQFIV